MSQYEDDEVEAGPAEVADKMARSDSDGRVHGVLGAPDPVGSDHVAELVATEFASDDELSAEEAALHFEE